MMKPLTGIGYFFLSSFSRPACDRAVYRTIRKNRITSILEIGLGNADRAVNMIRVAKKYSGSGTVRYTGIDRFEADPDSPITLKQCHQKLNRMAVKLQLVPGEMGPSVQRIANSHMRTDLLLVSSIYNTDELERVWYFVPRMLHAASVVFVQEPGDSEGYLEQLGRLEIERMLKQAKPATNRAAA